MAIRSTLLAPVDSIVTHGSQGATLTTRLSALRSLEVRDHSARRGLMWGSIIGGLVVSGVWASRARDNCEPATCSRAMFGAALDAAPLGVVYGGVTGAVLGAFRTGWSRRWP